MKTSGAPGRPEEVDLGGVRVEPQHPALSAALHLHVAEAACGPSFPTVEMRCDAAPRFVA